MHAALICRTLVQLLSNSRPDLSDFLPDFSGKRKPAGIGSNWQDQQAFLAALTTKLGGTVCLPSQTSP